MASRANASRAAKLLELASTERSQLRCHLLVAAALREVLPREPIVVGGTAEQYWTAGEFYKTDLDLCVPLGRQGAEALRQLGFHKEGRHWVHDHVPVAVEIPDSRIDGDEGRTILEPAGEGFARIIGVDDLYLDRLRQATVAERREDIHFESAYAVAVACYERIDRSYVRRRIGEVRVAEPPVGESMGRIDSRIGRSVRRLLSE